MQEWCEEYFGVDAFHGPAAADDLAAMEAAGWEPPEVHRPAGVAHRRP